MKSKKFCLCIPDTDKKRVIVIGGGFAGMNLVKKIDEGAFQVVFFDKNNYHTFIPLLYQAATAGIEPDSIADPLRNLVERSKDIHYRMAKVTSVDTSQKKVQTPIGNLSYDYLVIATGSKTNYFGNQSIQENGLPLKSLRNALNMRSKILESFEQATITQDPEERGILLNFVIVGGGPTGVELAGTLSEMRQYVLPKDFPELEIAHMRIYLIQSRDRLLPQMSDKAGERAYEYLKDMGIDIILNSKATHYDGKTVTLSSGEKLQAATLIWAAGVQGETIPGIREESIASGMYAVDEYCRVEGYEDVFAIGDVALLKNDKYPDGHPGVAQAAIQQGQQLAVNLKRIIKEQPLVPFDYHNRGTIATIGRNKAVADLRGNIKTGGWFAWFSWWVVHIYYIVGFRNKLGTFANWVLNYFAYKYSSRLIIKPFKPQDNEDDVQEAMLSRQAVKEAEEEAKEEEQEAKEETIEKAEK